jgi:hypothetical protein
MVVSAERKGAENRLEMAVIGRVALKKGNLPQLFAKYSAEMEPYQPY